MEKDIWLMNRIIYLKGLLYEFLFVGLNLHYFQ